jgi:hypothetical protein
LRVHNIAKHSLKILYTLSLCFLEAKQNLTVFTVKGTAIHNPKLHKIASMPNPININNTRSKKMTLRNIKNSQEKKQEIQILIRNHDVKI